MTEQQVDTIRHESIDKQFREISEKLSKYCHGDWELPHQARYEFNYSWAYAWYNKELKSVFFNTRYDYNETSTIIHELTHHLCKISGIDSEEGKGCHHLEFAIIWAVLYRNIGGHKSGYYFRAYDIQDDIAYDKLMVNPKKWDDMIRNYKFTDLEELIIFAIEKAKKYRAIAGY